MELLGLFFDHGGHWMLLLGALALVAATGVEETDGLRRSKAAFSTPLFGRGAVVVVLAAWVEHYGRQEWGGSFLVGSGSLPWLPLALLPAVLALAALAWLGTRRWPAARPWLTVGIVLVLVIASVRLLGAGPDAILGPGSSGPEVRFAQLRLDALGCFEAAGEPAETEGRYGTATFLAVVAFQQANGLDRPRLDQPFLGQVRPRHEWRLLTRPLARPERCGG